MTTEVQPRTQVVQETDNALRNALEWVIPERWYIHLILIFWVIVISFPLFYAMLISTQSNAMVFNHQLTPGPYLLQNLEVAVIDREMGRYMANSFLIATIIAVGKTIMSVLAGLGLVFFRYPGKWLVFGFVLITLIMPGEVLLIALYRRVANFDYWPHPYVALTLPLLASATGVFLFRQHFLTMPPDLSEAAQLDGANPVQFLFRVLVPLSWNTIGALMVLMFLFGWGQFLWPLTYLAGEQELQVVQWGMQSLAQGAEVGDNFGPMMAGAIITSLPPMIVFLILQRQFTKGFALTRDK